MSQDSKNFLAASVLNDGNIVTYRSLGQELKVHSNAAKRMLYEFYSIQRTKGPESINATYLLTGIPRALKQSYVNGHQPDGGDMYMQSSPYMSSSAPHQEDQVEAAPSKGIVLAKEEDLEAAKAGFKQIQSVHIYSLGPSRLQNLQVLSDCNRAISVKYANEDPLVSRGKYGVIHNAGVTRRTGRRPSLGVPPISAIVKASSKNQGINKVAKNAVKPFDGSSTSDKSNGSTSKAVVALETKVERPRDAEEKPASKRSAAKKESSEIFKSFSRPKTSLKHENTGISISASPVPDSVPLGPKSVQDETMRSASGDEQENDFVASNSVNPRISKSQSERAEQLRRMMEDEDEEMEDTVDDAPKVSQGSWPVNGSTSQKESPPETPIAITEGRRRGRRKVMKKKTTRDEEGYLVTKEEPAWESFSEDEPPQKQRALASTVASSLGKGKKAGGKPGQGNIMSFFGKK